MRPGRESEEVKPCMKINKRTMLINIARLLAELVAVAMVVIVALYGEGNPNSVRESDGSLQRVLDAGRLVLGLDVNFPPMSFTGSRWHRHWEPTTLNFRDCLTLPSFRTARRSSRPSLSM